MLVGRGAQYFLPPQCGLRVRLVAPFETRVKQVAERGKLSLEQARLKVEEIDKERSAFVWKIFKKDVGSPSNQDLVINTGGISIENATELVLAAIEKKLGVSLKKNFDRHNEVVDTKNTRNQFATSNSLH